MKRSGILREDRERLIALCKRMTPHERLMAYLRHSELMAKVYQAGVRDRSHGRRSSGKKRLRKR